ncbi:ADP-glyceromanno-heptose 6-epimerase [Aureibacter tunicatorum]|uniref:ADP-L-glycero-D-manno-heptose-6-epimerase n=1 Tax=Aureibacter tunicatorum TaxID=866807 RepID=A0AAE3XKV7_9BACT|nr:ADP-glyceromanno-heptose 6-epimerase [Aureibacter tunicatorum]MDR6238297.1 ADP-L-glycero-D-manno-heptose 6-epimerase [Aureibacter tunicatorum]BDD03330.1 ADP-L-glycero-D-manno-heptose-6-epimerase [Aureibacter tunicatorum]
MIIVTGASGFISSCLIAELNRQNFNAIIAVDDFNDPEKATKNLEGKNIQEKVDLEDFFEWFDKNYEHVEFVFHNGACSATTVFDKAVFDKLNYNYSIDMWQRCVKYQVPLVYASSAATYGMGELGYDDDPAIVPQLKPLNLYGESKNNFDIWALEQEEKPFFWAGLKYFNVYGPNEYHKGRMSSVVLHSFNQINATGGMKLFKSHNPNYKDGEQMRDFVYVKDVVAVSMWLMRNRKNSGIYNIGTGQARTFLDLVKATFKALDKEENISFIDTPEDIRDKYQYFTEAKMDRLREAGYDQPFTSLEDGVKDYVQNYLMKGLAVE